MPGNLSSPGASVASRVFALLGAFDAEHRSLSLSALAARTGLPLPTVHRIAAELVGLGGLERRGDRYVVGRRLWDLGLLAPVQSGVRQVAAPFLQDLYGATGATVHLAERDGTRVLYLDRVGGTRRCRWSAGSAGGFPCTPPESARCCWRGHPRTCSARCSRR